MDMKMKETICKAQGHFEVYKEFNGSVDDDKKELIKKIKRAMIPFQLMVDDSQEVRAEKTKKHRRLLDLQRLFEFPNMRPLYDAYGLLPVMYICKTLDFNLECFPTEAEIADYFGKHGFTFLDEQKMQERIFSRYSDKQETRTFLESLRIFKRFNLRAEKLADETEKDEKTSEEKSAPEEPPILLVPQELKEDRRKRTREPNQSPANGGQSATSCPSTSAKKWRGISTTYTCRKEAEGPSANFSKETSERKNNENETAEDDAEDLNQARKGSCYGNRLNEAAAHSLKFLLEEDNRLENSINCIKQKLIGKEKEIAEMDKELVEIHQKLKQKICEGQELAAAAKELLAKKESEESEKAYNEVQIKQMKELLK